MTDTTQPPAVSEEGLPPGRGDSVRRYIRTQKLGVTAISLFVLYVVAVFIAPLISPYSPTATDPRNRLAAPSVDHLLGTDEIGRDILSRTIFGGRTSLTVALTAVLIAVVFGWLIGLVTGFIGGWLDELVQGLLDALLSMPGLIVALAVVTVLGRSPANVVVAIAIVFIPRIARVVRSQALVVREAEFVAASRALGTSSIRIIRRHILPHTVAPLLVITTVLIGTAMLLEASLSFLGLGVPPPTPSWGQALGESLSFFVRAPWTALAPGMAVTMAVFLIVIIGDSLRDFLDVTTVERA